MSFLIASGRSIALRRFLSVTAFYLCFSPAAWALKVGDAVDSALLDRLKAKPGAILVVDFFAQWCESCSKELPLISKLRNELSDNARVQFIGVDTDDDLAVAEAFQQHLRAQGGLTFPVVNDLDQSIVTAFKPMGFPALYLIKNGVIVAEHLGATANIDAVIKNNLITLLEE